MATLRVMVVDDQDVVRMGLKGFIGAEPRRAPQTLPRWAAAGLALAGPLIGIAGFIIGQAQTVGTVLMVASGVGIALVVRQELAVHDVAVAHFVWATGHIPREACRPAIQ